MTRRIWVPVGAAVVVAVIATGGVVVASGGDETTSDARESAPDTAQVQRGRLSAMVSQDGTLAYRARPDGTAYRVIDQARGVYTELPERGDRVGCGGVLYRVDDKPVVLLCGTVPGYRDLHTGESGRDVRQLNRNLHELGDDAGAHVHIDPGDDDFTGKTEKALEVLQHRKGLRVTGALDLADVAFLSEPVRIARITAQLGGPARPGSAVLEATSDRLQVQVSLDPSQQGQVNKGDRARITLPGNTPVSGRVEGFGRVAQIPAGQGSTPADATIPTYIGLDDPARARRLDRAPVEVDITTRGVESALSVPVTALVGRSGGGFAVEVARTRGRRELVPVTLGLFDGGAGRVQVEGDLRAGDRVVVPSL